MAVNGGARKLSAKQEKAILALLSTRTVADAAEQSGVGVRTLERWLSEDEIFIESFRDVRTRVMEQAIARFQEPQPRLSRHSSATCLLRRLRPHKYVRQSRSWSSRLKALSSST